MTERFGLKEATIEKIASVFARHATVEKAVLYGSRAKGTYKNGSDIDLTLFAQADAEISVHDIANILDEIDDLLLPYTVDLSAFASLSNAKLREHIERVGKVFYQRDDGVTMKAGWQAKTIGEVCEVVNGGTPKTGVNEFWDGDNQWITPAEMGKLATPYVGRTERQITDKGLNNSSAKLLPKKSVILSSRAPIGHLVINTEPMATNQGCKGLIPSGNLYYKYLFYYLSSKVELLNSLGTGATFKELSGGKLKEVPIPVAPLPEQKRIVAILDEAFEGIATAAANAKKNLNNAREVFECYLQFVFTNKGVGWSTKTLGDICLIKPPKNEVRKKLGDSDLVSFVPMESMGIGQKYFDSSRVRTLEEVAGSYTYFADGDVLLAKITPCFENGKLGIARNLKNGVGFGSSEYIVFRTASTLHNEYLYYFLSRKLFREEGAARMMGAVGHKRVAKEFIENTLIPFPSISDQQRIVVKLDELSTETKKLEAFYQQKLGALDALKKSLLNQAFAGEL